MSDVKNGDGWVFGTWESTDCHECSCEFQVTRSASKTIFGRVLCDECKMHEEFNKERDAMQARIVELEKLAQGMSGEAVDCDKLQGRIVELEGVINMIVNEARDSEIPEHYRLRAIYNMAAKALKDNS